jgi:hypothetical protein
MYHRRCVILAVDSTGKLKIKTHTPKQYKEKLVLQLFASLSKLVEGVEAKLLELRPWH